jgi:hypothetical protein
MVLLKRLTFVSDDDHICNFISTQLVQGGIKREEHGTDSSLPSNAEVKNGGTITPLLHTPSWRGSQLIEHRDNFTLTCVFRMKKGSEVDGSRPCLITPSSIIVNS